MFVQHDAREPIPGRLSLFEMLVRGENMNQTLNTLTITTAFLSLSSLSFAQVDSVNTNPWDQINLASALPTSRVLTVNQAC